MAKVDRTTLEHMIDGRLSWPELRNIIVSFKDTDRFAHYLSILQARVEWTDQILLPLGPHLYIVLTKKNERIVKCDCGAEFGDYRRNWKLSALINVRSSEAELLEIYPSLMGPDPAWQVIREYICPGCAALLEVETVPPWYPVLFDFEPDLDAFYGQWVKGLLSSRTASR